jgi:hypothetical protein
LHLNHSSPTGTVAGFATSISASKNSPISISRHLQLG